MLFLLFLPCIPNLPKIGPRLSPALISANTMPANVMVMLCIHHSDIQMKLFNNFPFKKGNIRARTSQRTSILSEQIERRVKERDIIVKIHKIFNAVYENEFSSRMHSKTSAQKLLKQVGGYSLRKAKSAISDQAGYGLLR